MGTQAVDAAVQGDEDAVEIHQADSAHIAAAHAVPLKRLFVRILPRLLDGGGDMGFVSVGTVHLQDLHQHSLARLVVGGDIHPALVGQLFEGDVGFRAKMLVEEVVQDIPTGLAAVVLQLLHHLLNGDDDIEGTVMVRERLSF